MTPWCVLRHVFRLRFFDEVTWEGTGFLLKLITHRIFSVVVLHVHRISGRECWCVDHQSLLICCGGRGEVEVRAVCVCVGAC